MNLPTLGFIGLGRMGAPMSDRLVAAEYTVIAFDLAGTQQRLPAGAIAAHSVDDLVDRADIILLSLPDGAASRSVCAQIGRAPKRQARIVVDLSTVGVAAARDCADILGKAGVTYVDAPVSGGTAGARSGSLAMMVGANPDVFEAVRPVLAIIAKNCFRVGDAPGQGQAMKLVNNFISATAMAATSEAVVLGSKLGLDLTQMIEVINASSGRTTASTDKFPRSVIPRTYDFGFAGALMTKDVLLYLETAEAAGVPRQVGAAVANLWRHFNAACPGADFTRIHKYLEEGGDVAMSQNFIGS
jgi:3-hydroxyisobutyrate dehydrogenase